MDPPCEGPWYGETRQAGEPRRESSHRHEVLVYYVVGHAEQFGLKEVVRLGEARIGAAGGVMHGRFSRALAVVSYDTIIPPTVLVNG